jgi:hypothetical protein
VCQKLEIIIFSHCFIDAIWHYQKSPIYGNSWPSVDRWLEWLLRRIHDEGVFNHAKVTLRPHPNALNPQLENSFYQKLSEKYGIKLDCDRNTVELLNSNVNIVLITWYGSIYAEAIRANKKVFYCSGSPYGYADKSGLHELSELNFNLIKRVNNWKIVPLELAKTVRSIYLFSYPSNKSKAVNLWKIDYFHNNLFELYKLFYYLLFSKQELHNIQKNLCEKLKN